RARGHLGIDAGPQRAAAPAGEVGRDDPPRRDRGRAVRPRQRRRLDRQPPPAGGRRRAAARPAAGGSATDQRRRRNGSRDTASLIRTGRPRGPPESAGHVVVSTAGGGAVTDNPEPTEDGLGREAGPDFAPPGAPHPGPPPHSGHPP